MVISPAAQMHQNGEVGSGQKPFLINTGLLLFRLGPTNSRNNLMAASIMKRSRPSPPVLAAIEGRPESSWLYATGKRQRLVLPPAVVLTMAKHRQLKDADAEAGGMLFARISTEFIRVEEATEPQQSDRRSRFSFWPCTPTQQRLIDSRFKKGLHFIGEWHTHPEPCPHPSGLDLASMEKCFRESRHELKALVLVILGTDALSHLVTQPR